MLALLVHRTRLFTTKKVNAREKKFIVIQQLVRRLVHWNTSLFVLIAKIRNVRASSTSTLLEISVQPVLTIQLSFSLEEKVKNVLKKIFY